MAECRAGAYARDRQPGFAVHDLPAERNRAELCARFQAGKHAAELFGRPDGQSRRHEYQGRPGRADRRVEKGARQCVAVQYFARLAAEQILDYERGGNGLGELCADMLSKYHLPVHTASEQPAVNATTEGYFVANQLPVNYVNTQFIDSKEPGLRDLAEGELVAPFRPAAEPGESRRHLERERQCRSGRVLRKSAVAAERFPSPAVYGHSVYLNLAVYLEDNLTLRGPVRLRSG